MDCILFYGDKGEASRRQVRSAAAQHSHRIGPRKPKSSKKPRSEEPPSRKRTLKANPIVPHEPGHSPNRTAKEHQYAAASSSGSSSASQHSATTSPRPSSSKDGGLDPSKSPRQRDSQVAQLDAKLTIMDERLDRQKRTFDEDQARRQRQRRVPPLRWKQTIITGSPPSPPPPAPLEPSLERPAPPGSSNDVAPWNARADSATHSQPEQLHTAPPPAPITIERIPQITTTTGNSSHSRQSSSASSLSPTSQLPLYSWTEYPRYSRSSQKYADPRGMASSAAPTHTLPPARSLAWPALVSSTAPAQSSVAPELSTALARAQPTSWRPLDPQGLQHRGAESDSTRPRDGSDKGLHELSRAASRDLPRPETSPGHLAPQSSDRMQHQQFGIFLRSSGESRQYLDDSAPQPRPSGIEK